MSSGRGSDGTVFIVDEVVVGVKEKRLAEAMQDGERCDGWKRRTC